MAKSNQSVYVCDNCGHESPRWQGKCPECEQWNTFVKKQVITATSGSNFKGNFTSSVTTLNELKNEKFSRFSSGFGEVDNVLGGGIVPGSLILLGGDPGVGKSTLSLQIAGYVTESNSVLYVSGEESVRQLKSRAERLSVPFDLMVMSETDLDTIAQNIITTKPDLVIIDSIQTVSSNQVNGVIGGVSQLSYSTNSLLRLAKSTHTSILLIGHVTKEGILAGPKTIEHMVDTVLYLEGDRYGNYRLLRTSKNRFGSVSEVGVFTMDEKGLEEIVNPSAMFLDETTSHLSGSTIAPILEGNKVLMLEIQALTSTTNFGNPRRTTSGFDLNRLQMLGAIIQKNSTVNLSNQDIYINVAGGFSIQERAGDLACTLSILSSYTGKILPAKTVAIAEVGLLGELRSVPQINQRISECKKIGYKDIVVSQRDYKNNKVKGINVQSIRSVSQCMGLLTTPSASGQ